MNKIIAILLQDQNLLKNLLYNISVPPPMIKHKDMIQDQMNIPHDTVVEVHPVMTSKNIIDNDPLQELAIITIEQPLLHITPDLVMTTITSNQNHRDYLSRLEISFLLDSGASISVLNHPTYITIAKLLNNKQNPPHSSSKTLAVASQTEVPILHYITITLNTTIEDNSRQLTILSAVSDIKYNILGTPFFEENIQNINIQDFTI